MYGTDPHIGKTIELYFVINIIGKFESDNKLIWVVLYFVMFLIVTGIYLYIKDQPIDTAVTLTQMWQTLLRRPLCTNEMCSSLTLARMARAATALL